MDLKKILKLKPAPRDLEPQEILLDALASRKEEEIGRFEVPLSELVLKFILGIFAVIFAIFFLRVVQFQVLSGEKYKILSERNQYIIKNIKASRGVVYDRNMKQLVFNIPRFDLICDNKDVNDDFLRRIASLIPMPLETLKAQLRHKDKKIVLAKDLSQEAIVAISSRLSEFSGCEIFDNTVRQYDNEAFSHVIGYKKDDGQGDGIEKMYDDILKAKEGKINIERDAKGNIKSETITDLPQSGKSIVLNIDGDLQKKIQTEMKKGLDQSGAVTAAAVAMNPQTGEILALVSLPGYDSNIFTKGVSQEDWDKLVAGKHSVFMNRAIAGQYPSGSTIKPFVGLAALENGIITEQTQIYCPLQICIANKYSGEEECFVDWKYHGSANITRAIAESINPFFYTISGGFEKFKGLGAVKLTDYISKFGFGTSTGIDLAGEQPGILPTPEWKEAKLKEPWSLGDTYNLAIGQGFFQTTPLQIARAVSAIANGGTLWTPKVIRRIVDENKDTVQEFKPEVVKSNLIEPQSLEIMRRAMKQTVDLPAGTAHKLAGLPISSASKTGTAQISRANHYDIWIAIFAPYENAEIVLVLLAEEVPTTNFFVLPVSYEILNWYFTRDKEAVATSSAPLETAPAPSDAQFTD